jgi:hypothetical protein
MPAWPALKTRRTRWFLKENDSPPKPSPVLTMGSRRNTAAVHRIARRTFYMRMAPPVGFNSTPPARNAFRTLKEAAALTDPSRAACSHAEMAE